MAVGKRDRRRAARAPQLGDRHPEHVRPKTQLGREIDVERRDHVARARDADHEVDLVGGDAGARQSIAGRCSCEPPGVTEVGRLHVSQRPRL